MRNECQRSKNQTSRNPFELRGTGPPTSRTFVLGDEDHTLGNALRHVLIQDPRVNFAGYCVPHPSEPVVHLRVQTNATATSGGVSGRKNHGRSGRNEEDDDDSDEEEIVGGLTEEGSTSFTAIDALKDACRTLSQQCEYVLEQLEVAMPEVRVDRERLKRLEEDMFLEKEKPGEMDEEEGEEELMEDMEE
ncbi:hypothetical protein HJC23_008221 [Cyclotella cryptica]|uniref:DNA-directed RNA polymerase RBP11-like dimerisation domain-containing protein n=1 Tax=Cyclotella cryptica TaxID=29204 RepID=A0ABD3NJL0_9STRA